LLSKLAKASDSRPAPVIVKGAKARVVRRYDFAGLPIAVEFPAAVRRVIKNRDGKVVYDCVLPNDYGYIESTFGLDGDEIDVIVGPDEKSDAAYCVDMIDLGPDVAQRQNEQKILIGFPDREFATEAFLGMYPESFMGRMIEMPVQALIEKLAFHKALTNNERALALDAEFEESKHPRVKGGENAGQFGKGSGSSQPESQPSVKFEPSAKMLRAMKAQNYCGVQKQRIADEQERIVAKSIGVPRTRDNSAFDMRNDDVGIELKTMQDSKNGRITMSKAALGRKLGEAKDDDLRTFTVVADKRSGGGGTRYYIKEGLGSFHIGSMTPTTLAEIRGMVR
jgi:hypothetical protein